MNTENGVDLYIISSDGSDKKQLTDDEYVEDSAKFIPGQNKIVYVRKSDSVLCYSLCTINTDGSGKTVVWTSTVQISGLYPSPDGTKIAFIINENVVALINADGTGYNQIVDNIYSDKIFWSPDSKKIVYSVYSKIYIKTLSDNTTFYLCDGYYPDWSSTDKIVYCGNTWPNYGLYTINSDGTNNTLLISGYYENPRWSPDSTKICYKKSGEIYIINSDGAGNTKISEYNFFAFSPTSDRVSYNTHQNIYTIKTDATDKKNLTNNALPYYFDLINIGARVVYVAVYDEKQELRTIDENGKNEALLDTTTTYFSNKLSPDGKKVAYSYLYDGRYYVKVKDIYGNSVYSVDSSSETYHINWSQDSKKIVFGLGTELTVSDFSSLTKVVISPDSIESWWYGGSVSSFSTDGTKIAFCGNVNGVYGIYIMNVDGTNKQKIADGNSPFYAPINTKLAYICCDANLWLYENGTNTQITKIGNIYEWEGITWSPDGTKVATVDKIIDIATGVIYKFNTDEIDFGSSKIVYDEYLSDGVASSVVISNPDGSERQQLTSASYSFGYAAPKFSPDGEKVFYNHGGDIYLSNLYSGLQAKLEQNHILPVNNVFNPKKGDACKVFYSVPQAGNVTIKLYTTDGVFIKTLVNKDVLAGTYSEDWYGKNMDEEIVASGIYYIHIEASGGVKQTKKICVVK